MMCQSEANFASILVKGFFVMVVFHISLVKVICGPPNVHFTSSCSCCHQAFALETFNFPHLWFSSIKFHTKWKIFISRLDEITSLKAAWTAYMERQYKKQNASDQKPFPVTQTVLSRSLLVESIKLFYYLQSTSFSWPQNTTWKDLKTVFIVQQYNYCNKQISYIVTLLHQVFIASCTLLKIYYGYYSYLHNTI